MWLQGQHHVAVQPSNDSTAVAAGEAVEVVMPGMDFMMECYEDELKKPIRNLVSGQLARSLLIQVGNKDQSILTALLRHHTHSCVCICSPAKA